MIQVSCFGGLPDSSPDLPPIHIIESEINSWWQSTSLSIILNQSHLSNRTKLKVQPNSASLKASSGQPLAAGRRTQFDSVAPWPCLSSLQCEECLCWQHGTCMGLLEENVPDKYACYVCRDPPGESQQHTTWLNRNSISGFSMGLLGEGKGEVNTQDKPVH